VALLTAVFRGRRLAAGLLLLVSTAAAPSAQSRLPFELRAVYLYNFARFAEWPADAFAEPNAPIRVCVLGSDPLGPALDRALQGELVGGRPIQATRLRSPAAARDCHILYTAATERARVLSALAAVRGRPVLTVGEHAAFLEAGGMIRFHLVDQRVRFDINVSAAEQARLRLSARLLGVAAHVRRDPGP
jgi:hypothetical protein